MSPIQIAALALLFVAVFGAVLLVLSQLTRNPVQQRLAEVGESIAGKRRAPGPWSTRMTRWNTSMHTGTTTGIMTTCTTRCPRGRTATPTVTRRRGTAIPTCPTCTMPIGMSEPGHRRRHIERTDRRACTAQYCLLASTFMHEAHAMRTSP